MAEQSTNINQLYNVGNNPPIADIRFLSESQECDFIEFLAYLDLGKNEVPLHKRKFVEKDILQKLFINIEESGEVLRKSSLNFDKSLFLKNKYLYLYGEGASYYLQARQSMSDEKNSLDKLEVETLQNYLEERLENLTLVSLGSANAVKEIDVLSSLAKEKGSITEKFLFIPIDVSTSLIQLATLYFYKNFEKGKYGDISPIIGDIWDVAKKKDILFPVKSNGQSVFTLLGSTIGNYREKEFLEQILMLMTKDDALILGFDIIENGISTKEKNFIYEQYNTLGNVQFMLNPINYIPKFKGYIEKFDKYFKLNKENSIVTEASELRYNQLTDVPGCICYAPLLDLPPIENASASKIKITVAQSTKYDLKKFKEVLLAINYIDSSNNKHKFTIDEDSSAVKSKAACLVLKKLIEVDTTNQLNEIKKDIANLLFQYKTDATDNNKELAKTIESLLPEERSMEILQSIKLSLSNGSPLTDINDLKFESKS